MEEKRLFLLDAYALIYRAYYALIRAPRVTSKGFNTSAIFGFCNTLDEILRKENPTHIAVCFDPPGGHTFRHDMYPEYKATRDKQPEDITAAIPYIKEILKGYQIPVIEVDGYEADDVIGTISRHAERDGYITYMMTPDKDYGQLVTDRVLMYRPSLRGEGFEIRGPEQVCERYGISSPHQVIDLLALEGDVSDNVPGCPGVGEKTAQKLISEWGSVENLLANVGSLKGALQKKIADNSEQILFSKELVTIKTDVPLPEDAEPESLVRRGMDSRKLREIFTELEFRSFMGRLDGGESKPQAAEPKVHTGPTQGSLFDMPADDAPASTYFSSVSSVDHKYKTAMTPEEIAKAVAEALASDKVGVAFNVDGEEAMTAIWRGIAISTKPHSATYIPIPSGDREARLKVVELIRPLYESGTLIVSHDVKRDYLILKREGVAFRAPYYDTSVAHYVLESEMKHTLPMLTMRYLDYEMQPEDAADYVCEAADATLRLQPIFTAELAKENQTALVDEIEFPLIRVLAEMEWTGVRIDIHELGALSEAYSARLTEMEEQVYLLAGERFNIGSPMQVGEVLFGRMAIDPTAKRTKKGAYSTTEEVLSKYKATHPVVDLILKIRALKKLLATYINALPALINPRTGKIHTSYNQTVTATGRISSTNPNLQNIPIRSDDGREIRRAFIPDPGHIFMSADYSQIELRLMAHMSGDEGMIDAFLSGHDIHRATAAKIFHEPIDAVTDDQRRRAKTANFGIIYGISAFGLSERLGIPRKEAKELIEGYFATYPGVRKYMDDSVEHAREKGYVTTVRARKRMLPEINSRNAVVRGYAERNAINAPLQGSAADIIKIAMIRVAADMEAAGLKSKMIMQVHDELVFDVVPGELERLKEIVVHDMMKAFDARVPMEVSVGMGRNWLEAH